MSPEINNEALPPSSEDVSLLDLLKVLVDNLRLLVIGPLMIGILVTILVYFLVAPRYTSTVKFIAPQPPQSVGAGALSALGLQGLGGGIGATLRNPTDIYLAFLSSNRVRDALIAEHKLADLHPGKSRDEMRTAVGKQAEIKLGRDGILTIEVSDTNAQRASAMANRFPKLLQEMMTEYGVNEANARKLFLTKQVAQMQVSIREQEAELKQTGMNTDMLKLDMGSSVAEVANLKAAITSQEIRLRALASYLAPTAPDYRLAEGELSSLRAQLQKVESVKTKQAVTSNYPEKYRSYLYDLQLLENLIKQAELAQIDASKEDLLIQVMDPAEPADRKSDPSYRNTLIVSTLVSGFLLLFWVYLKFGLRRARSNHPEVAQKLDGLSQSWRQVWGRNSKSLPHQS